MSKRESGKNAKPPVTPLAAQEGAGKKKPETKTSSGRPPEGQACYDDRDCGTNYIGRR
jgi:hypothetical protein